MTESSPLLTRRKTLSLIGGLIVAAPLGLALPGSAGAARGWCLADPDVYLEGTFVRIDVGIPPDYLSLVNGPTSLWFNLPSDVDRRFAWADDGFNNLGYNVGFSTAFQPNKFDKKFSVNLTIKVPIKGNAKVPIWCAATPDKGDYVERTGNDAKTGTSLNFTVYGSL
jgi:hypothetical protein